MLTEICSGNHLYCVHTMSATIMPIHLKDGTYLQITFMKYDQYCPQILAVNAQNILFHIFFSVKLSKKAYMYYTESLPEHAGVDFRCNPGKSFSKHESHPRIFATARPDFGESGC